MPLFKRGPKMETVRAQLLQLIQEAKAAADRQAQSDRDQPGKITVSFAVLPLEDLVPTAKRIITHKIAKRVEASGDDARLLLGGEAVLSTVPAEDIDLYLTVALATFESWLGHEGSSGVRFHVSSTGQYCHSLRAQEHFQAERWAAAEAELRKALDYARLGPGAGLVSPLCNIGHAVHKQGRGEEAKKLYEEALALFEQLRPEAIGYDTAKQSADQVKRILGRS